MNNHARRTGNRMLSLLLTLVLLTLQFAGVASADVSPASSTLAEWKYSANPADQSVFTATYGLYKGSSALQAVPARATETFGWDDSLQAIRYQGWHEETGKEKYWLATVSTKEFQQITLSSEQQGRGSTGPRDFRVQFSTDGQQWSNLTGDGTGLPDLVMNEDTATRLTDVPLPGVASDRERLYIRWLVVSNVSTSGTAIGESGSSQLISVTVKGVRKGSSSDVTAPTVPAGLSGQAISDTSIRLTWTASTDNVGVAGYNIYREGVKVGTAPAASYEDTGLAAAKNYTYHVTAYDGAGNESGASSQIAVSTLAAASRQKVAEWTFAGAGSDGVWPATDGAYKSASTFRNIGGVFEAYDSDKQAISYQGWDNGSGSKYWLATVSTKGFEQIALSSQQNSSGSGPRDFKVQISTDKRTWTDVPNTDLTMVTSSFNCANQSCKLIDASLPAEADNRDILYIRWIVRSDTNTKGSSGIGGSGSSRIKDIRVSGKRIDGAPIVIPTIDTAGLPKDGAVQVSAAAPVSVTFNKPIALNPGYEAAIVDDHNRTLAPVTLEIINQVTLNIQHPNFAYGKTYTVKLPKELIRGKDDQVPLARDIVWSFTVQDSPYMPKLINMTLNGDARTSLAFAWYTDVKTGTVVQVAEADKVKNGVFPEAEAVAYSGSVEEIETFMKKSDRETGRKTKFMSHKAIAAGLKPGTAYKFRVGNGEPDGWSAVGSFKTDAGKQAGYRFIAGSDSQSSSKSGFEPWGDTFRKAIDHIGDPKFLINAGDLVDNGDLEEQWQWMLGAAQNELLNVPFVPVLGGHEVQDYDGDETTPNNNFYNHFNLPKQEVEGTHEGSVYSFEYGDALYLVFNSQFVGGLAQNGVDVEWADKQFWDQVAWMKNTVARSDKKWKFVTFHKGPYSAGDNAGEWEDERVQFYRKYLIPAFDEMGIDMVFEAHDHMYMRSFQMYNDKIIPASQLTFDQKGNAVNPKGTVYLMSNAFGNKFYEKYVDKNGVPYDDFFAAIDTQPFKKMFTDVSVSDEVLKFTAYTAAVEDEKPGDSGVQAYDRYGIRRTDGKPAKVEDAKVQVTGNQAILSWKAPAGSAEPVRGFRIYEKNDKVKTHWSVYVPAGAQAEYTYAVADINPAKKYDFVVKAVGARINSDTVEVSTQDGPVDSDPPSAPTSLTGNAVSAFQIQLNWKASAGKTEAAGYNIYRNGVKVGTTTATSYSDTGLKPATSYSYEVKAYNAETIESLPSNRIEVATKPASSGDGPFKAYPQHTVYAGDSIKPNHVTQAEMDATVTRLYKEWKAKYLKRNPYDPTQYYVWYADGDWFKDGEITVSEAHGYGMLITALMAGHDPEAKTYFDGMYRYFRAHPSAVNPQLMAWQQADNGSAIVDINGADSAADGDMDIAYALLLADRQWGSAGEINYLEQARKVIDAIMESEVNHTEWTLKLADWAKDEDPMYGKASRPSDFMLQHLKDFRIVSGDSRWDKVIDQTYRMIRSVHEKYSPNSGLLPDFVFKDTDGQFKPVSEKKWDTGNGYFLEGEHDGDYSYNASRVPWRLGTDFLLTGDRRAKEQLGRLNGWIRAKTGGKPEGIKAGYKLDGSAALGEDADLSFSAPFMVSAMTDSSNQQWLNDLWDYNAAIPTEDALYFGNNLRLLSMLVVSGNWWTPAIVDTESPTEPTIERAEAVSDSAIDLKWTGATDNFGIAGYKIYRNNTEIYTTTKTEFRDTGLSPNTTYRYFVMAFDAAGNYSKISNVRVVSTLSDSGSDSDSSGSGGSGGGSGGGSSAATDGKLSIPAGGSGTTSLGNAITVTVPAGAADQALTLTVEKVADPSKLLTQQETKLSPVFELTKNFTGLFKKPVTLTIAFDPSLLRSNQTPAVFVYDGEKKQWTNIGGTVDGSTIKVNVDDTGIFAVFAVDKKADDVSAEPKPVSFTDTAGHWVEGIIRQAVTSGIVTGYPDGSFKPDHIVTRAEFAVMLAGTKKLAQEGAALSFADRSEIGDWAEKAVAQAVQAGIVQGYEDGTFRPNAQITRAEMAVMIANAQGAARQAAGSAGFSDDADIPGWAKTAVEAIHKLGLVEGREGNRFAPGASATRAEAVKVLLKLKQSGK
ncbi:glycosyl hydrolase family 8 [Paenibacillus elgii]|uniref:glycosyl hydrolase family 8 n=1 Tax=Paenibacillus elgii TaxID=189691 RepID=UPI0013CF8C41|nr:glycosyl hydrolase family 8 [Paenibacillus elgii]